MLKTHVKKTHKKRYKKNAPKAHRKNIKRRRRCHQKMPNATTGRLRHKQHKRYQKYCPAKAVIRPKEKKYPPQPLPSPPIARPNRQTVADSAATRCRRRFLCRGHPPINRRRRKIRNRIKHPGKRRPAAQQLPRRKKRQQHQPRKPNQKKRKAFTHFYPRIIKTIQNQKTTPHHSRKQNASAQTRFAKDGFRTNSRKNAALLQTAATADRPKRNTRKPNKTTSAPSSSSACFSSAPKRYMLS